MAHLTLNGVDVTTRRGGQVRRQRIGKMSRALSGSVLEEIQARKRAWRFTTDILGQTDFEKVRKLIEGLGDGWPYDGDGYSHKGVGPDSNEQATYLAAAADGLPIDTDWKYGRSVFVSSAAVNLCPENVRTGTDSGGDTTGFTAGGTALASHTDGKWQGSKSLRVLWDGVGADFFEVDAIAIAAGTAYTFSFYARAHALYINDYDIELIGDVSGVLVSKTTGFKDGIWERFEVRATTGGADTTLKLKIIDNDNSNPGTFYFDGFQLEANDIATAWVDGTRAAADDLAYGASSLPDLSGDLTVMFWVGAASRTDWSDTAMGLISLHDGTAGVPDDGMEISIGESGDVVWAITRSGGATGLSVIGVAGVTADDSSGPIVRSAHHVAVVIRRSPVSGESKLELFIDGTSDKTDDTGNYFDGSLITVLEIGSYREGSGQLDGWADDLTILPYALTAAEIAAVYAFGVANPALPELRMEGDVIPESSLTVLGHALSDRLSPVNIGGAWDNNAARLEFELLEV